MYASPDVFDEKPKAGGRRSGSSEGFGAVIFSFLAGTSAHGLPRVASEGSSIRKAFWGIVFLGAFGYFSYLMYLAFSDYLGRPVGVNINFYVRTSADFPAVTVCNMNPLKKTKLKGTVYQPLMTIDDQYRAAMQQSLGGKGGGPGNANIGNSNSNSQEKDDRDEEISNALGSAGKDGLMLENSDFISGASSDYDFESFISYSKTDDFSDLTDLLRPSKEELDNLGHMPEDFILQCSFDKTNCSYLDFHKVYNNRYGNCYTFNHGYNGTATRTTTNYGSRYGLRLTLNLERMDYIGVYSHATGAKVAVHPPNITAFPEDEGVNAPSGLSTAIGVTTKTYARLAHPYATNCSDGTGQSLLNSNKKYTVWACMLACLQKNLRSQCSCSDMAGLGTNDTRCSITNATQEICRQQIYLEYNRGSLGCDCRLPCKEIKYNTRVSTADWPTMAYIPILFDSIGEVLQSKGFGKIEDAVDTLARVHVYMEEFIIESVEEFASYTEMDLLADMGGYLGLFVGISVCTLLEFFEFLVDILGMSGIACFTSCRDCSSKKKRISSTSSHSTPVQVLKIPPPPGPEIQVVSTGGKLMRMESVSSGPLPPKRNPQYATQW